MGKWRKQYGQERRWARNALIKRDGMICQLCHEPIERLDDVTIDHIIPVSKGGLDRLDNYRLAHEGCNRERGAGFFTIPINGPDGKMSLAFQQWADVMLRRGG